MMCTTDDDDIDFSSIKKNVLQVVHERRKQRVIQNISFSHKRREVHSPLPPGVGVCVLDFFFSFFFCGKVPKSYALLEPSKIIRF